MLLKLWTHQEGSPISTKFIITIPKDNFKDFCPLRISGSLVCHKTWTSWPGQSDQDSSILLLRALCMTLLDAYSQPLIWGFSIEDKFVYVQTVKQLLETLINELGFIVPYYGRRNHKASDDVLIEELLNTSRSNGGHQINFNLLGKVINDHDNNTQLFPQEKQTYGINSPLIKWPWGRKGREIFIRVGASWHAFGKHCKY